MPTFIYREEVKRLMAAGAQVVEALPAEDYEDEHLPGAISLPLADIANAEDVLDSPGAASNIEAGLYGHGMSRDEDA